MRWILRRNDTGKPEQVVALRTMAPEARVVAAYDALPVGMQAKLMTEFPDVYWALARLSAHQKSGVTRRYWGNS